MKSRFLMVRLLLRTRKRVRKTKRTLALLMHSGVDLSPNAERLDDGPSSLAEASGSCSFAVAPQARPARRTRCSAGARRRISTPAPLLLDQLSKSLSPDSPPALSPTPLIQQPQQVLAAATPSPMNTTFSQRKRFFLEAVEAPSLASLRRSSPKPPSSRVQTL